VRTEIDKGMLK